MATAGANGPVPEGQGVIVSKVDRASSAQGPGADLGLYAATPDAFSTQAASAGTALVPFIAWTHDSAQALPRAHATDGSTPPLILQHAHGLPEVSGPNTIGGDQPHTLYTPPTSTAPHAEAQPLAGNASLPSYAGHGVAEHLYLQMQANEMRSDLAVAVNSSGDASTVGNIHSSFEAPVLDVAVEKAALLASQASATLSTVQAVATTIAAKLAEDGQALGQTIDMLQSEFVSLPQPVDLLTPLLDEATSGLKEIADVGLSSGDAVTEHLASVGAEAASVLSNSVAGTAQTVADITTSLVQPLPDTLADLAGNDPAGGVSTLVGLVSAADAFGVSDDGPLDIGLADGLGASGMLDLLSPPVIDTVILGGDEPLDHVLSHLDDNHLGLG